MAHGVAGPDTSVREVGGPAGAVGAKRLHRSRDLGIIVSVAGGGASVSLESKGGGEKEDGRSGGDHFVVVGKVKWFRKLLSFELLLSRQIQICD